MNQVIAALLSIVRVLQKTSMLVTSQRWCSGISTRVWIGAATNTSGAIQTRTMVGDAVSSDSAISTPMPVSMIRWSRWIRFGKLHSKGGIAGATFKVLNDLVPDGRGYCFRQDFFSGALKAPHLEMNRIRVQRTGSKCLDAVLSTSPLPTNEHSERDACAAGMLWRRCLVSQACADC